MDHLLTTIKPLQTALQPRANPPLLSLHFCAMAPLIMAPKHVASQPTNRSASLRGTRRAHEAPTHVTGWVKDWLDGWFVVK